MMSNSKQEKLITTGAFGKENSQVNGYLYLPSFTLVQSLAFGILLDC